MKHFVVEFDLDDNNNVANIICNGKQVHDIGLIDHGRSTEHDWQLVEDVYLVQQLD